MTWSAEAPVTGHTTDIFRHPGRHELALRGRWYRSSPPTHGHHWSSASVKWISSQWALSSRRSESPTIGSPRSSTSLMHVTRQTQPETLHETRLPGVVAHLLPRRIKEGDVLDVGAADRAAREELAALQHRLFMPDAGTFPHERQKFLLASRSSPMISQVISLSWQ